MRARRVITRGGKTIRKKFPSRKLSRQVHCESLLERDAALMFELHPLVASFQEQPSKETYYSETGLAQTCFPDFSLRLIDGSEVLIEVKRKVDLSRPKICKKLQLISLRFAEQKREYRIRTEEHIHREPLRKNLEALWEASRATRVDTGIHAVVSGLSDQRLYTLEELTVLLGNEQVVLALVACGRLRMDLESQRSLDSKIWTASNQEAGDGSFFI